jgi:hypothetical protein
MCKSDDARVRALARGCGVFGLSAVSLLAAGGCGSSPTKAASTRTASTAGTRTAGAASAPAGTVSATASQSSRSVSASSGKTTVTLRAGSHEPRTGTRWPIHFTATSAAAPAHASVSYEYLLGGQIVARRSYYTFVGRFDDFSIWPRDAVGYPLTFRAVVKVEPTTFNLDYPLRVRP